MDDTSVASSALAVALARPRAPLVAAAVVNLFVGRRLGKFAGVLASGAVGAVVRCSRSCSSFASSCDASAEERVVHRSTCSTGSRSGGFAVGADLRLDVLSATMILVITGIGFLIHVYAIGYMEGDPRYGRFFAYLNLFVFFMLLLVLADNYLLLYVGWEGVGLCSYLLIGFWFEKTENASAAKKAFVTTRIGDTAMLIGLALIVSKFGTLDFGAVLGAPGDDDREGHRDRDLAPLVRRGDREVGAGAAPRLAPRRDGRPHAGLRADPRRDDGHGRRLPRRPERAAVRGSRGRAHGGPDRRARDGAVRGDMCPCAGRHQAGPRVLHGQPARVHVHGSGHALLHGRDVHARRPRVLQGPDVPGRGLRDARDARGDRPATDGRADPTDADHGVDVRRRRARAGGRVPARRLLREGPDPRDREPHRAHVDLPPRDARRPPVRALHRPARVPRVLRIAEERGGRARPRVAVGHDDPAPRARGRRGPRRSPPVYLGGGDAGAGPRARHRAGAARARGCRPSPCPRSRPRSRWARSRSPGGSTRPAGSSGSPSASGSSRFRAQRGTAGTSIRPIPRCS